MEPSISVNAAVAAGICRLAVGSQTLQSVVVPAAYCGVVGYKTTFGRLPFDGLALSPSSTAWVSPPPRSRKLARLLRFSSPTGTIPRCPRVRCSEFPVRGVGSPRRRSAGAPSTDISMPCEAIAPFDTQIDLSDSQCEHGADSENPHRGGRSAVGRQPNDGSHVLTGNRPVAARTRVRVQHMIDELGFRPNGLARSLRIHRSDTVALIIPDISNPFYPVFARGLHDAMSGRYRTYICNTDAVRERELEFAADVNDRQVDGMVIVAFQIGASDLLHILDLGMPVVFLGQSIDNPRVDVVLTDDEHGAFGATSHLILRGHTRVGMVREVEGTDLQRFVGYRRALESNDIPFDPELTAIGDWTRSGDCGAMRILLTLPNPPTAVFSANDLMAIGGMDAAREAGFLCPATWRWSATTTSRRRHS